MPPMIASAEDVAKMSDKALRQYFTKAAVFNGKQTNMPNWQYVVMFGSKTLHSADTAELFEQLKAECKKKRLLDGIKRKGDK